MASDLDSYQTYKAAMGFKPAPATSPLGPDETARKEPAPPDGPLPVEDPWAGSAWAGGSPIHDERQMVLDCLGRIVLSLLNHIQCCHEDRPGCEALIRLMWAVKQREFDLRLEKPNN